MTQKYWQVFLICVVFIQAYFCTPAIRPASQRAVIYPTENWDDCVFDEVSNQAGQCTSLDNCPDVLRKWQKENIYPKTCYFIKQDQYVCCPIGRSKPTVIESVTVQVKEEGTTREPTLLELIQASVRRSELECDLNQRVESTIVHGLPTKANEFPYMATLGWASLFSDSIWYRCGGVLISSKYVLTAAHCADVGGLMASVVRLGGTNLTDTDTVMDVKIKRFIKHPEYKDSAIYNDIALVELEEEVQGTAICLWNGDEFSTNNVTAIGYGNIQFGGLSSSQLLKVALNIVPQKECEQYYPANGDVAPNGIVQSHLCAGDPEHLRDTCQGDSGGPLILERGLGATKQSFIVGVTSFGLGCSGEPPSIYTRVSSYLDWIEDIVWPKLDTRFEKL